MNEIKTFNPVNERYETMNGMWMKWTWMNSEWKWREHKGAERTGTECNEGTVSESVSESWIEFHSRKRAKGAVSERQWMSRRANECNGAAGIMF